MDQPQGKFKFELSNGCDKTTIQSHFAEKIMNTRCYLQDYNGSPVPGVPVQTLMPTVNRKQMEQLTTSG